MYKIRIARDLHKREEYTELRFKLLDGRAVQLEYNSGVMVKMEDLGAFTLHGDLKPDVESFNFQLKNTIDVCKAAMGQAYLTIIKQGRKATSASFRKAVDALLHKDEDSAEPPVAEQSLVERYRQYVEEERRNGLLTDRMFRNMVSLGNKLERFFLVLGCPRLPVKGFTTELLTDFEKFCIDEYLYAADPKYADIYPRGYDAGRSWPKRKLKEEPLKKILNHFKMFWRDMVSFGEVEVSPYDEYVPWMKETQKKRYSELVGTPLSLTLDEFQKVLSTPVPESMAETRNAFILHVCLGCKAEDFRNLTMNNLAVSSGGIPYVSYIRKDVWTKEKKTFEYKVKVPLVRVAFDIVMRTRFNFFFGCYNTPYNRKMQLFLRHCGITREVDVFNTRTNAVETVPLCDVMTQMFVQRTHMDLLQDAEDLYRGVRGSSYTGTKAMRKYMKLPMGEYFKKLNRAMAQPPFRVDENLNIIEGTPFEKVDLMVYKELPEKYNGGGTIPYLITSLSPMPSEENASLDRIEIVNLPPIRRERKVAVLGNQFLSFMDGLEEEHQLWIEYGLLVLKRVYSFDLAFIRNLGSCIYALRTALRGFVYTTSFYVNGDTIILMHCRLAEKHRRKKGEDKVTLSELRAMRWNHVLGNTHAEPYDGYLDELYGIPGSPERAMSYSKALSSYTSQVLRTARVETGMDHVALAAKMGLERSFGRISAAENGTRVLPMKYLVRYLNAIGQKAVITRPQVVED